MLHDHCSAHVFLGRAIEYQPLDHHSHVAVKMRRQLSGKVGQFRENMGSGNESLESIRKRDKEVKITLRKRTNCSAIGLDQLSVEQSHYQANKEVRINQQARGTVLSY